MNSESRSLRSFSQNSRCTVSSFMILWKTRVSASKRFTYNFANYFNQSILLIYPLNIVHDDCQIDLLLSNRLLFQFLELTLKGFHIKSTHGFIFESRHSSAVFLNP